MVERLWLKVGVQRAVDHFEYVAVKRGGHSCGVVVGGPKPADVLDQIRAEQERVAGGERTRDRAQERGARRRLQVADRRPEEHQQPASASGEQRHVAFEVPDHRGNLDAGMLGGHRLPGGEQRRLVNVERDEATQRPLGGQRGQQQPGLLRRTRPDLHQGVGAGPPRDRRRHVEEHRAFGTGGVVLGQPGDLLEKPAAAFMVAQRGEIVRHRSTSFGWEAASGLGGVEGRCCR